MTPRMLLWLRKYLEHDSGLSRPDVAALWCALMTGFFFMLRASEYLVQDGRSWSLERVLHGDDLAPRLSGVELRSFKLAEEVVINIKGSKTDQCNVGAVRTQYATGARLVSVCPWHRPEGTLTQSRCSTLCNVRCSWASVV